MKPQLTSFKVADMDYPIKSVKNVPDGVVYTTTIDGRDFCILESHEAKATREALVVNIN